MNGSLVSLQTMVQQLGGRITEAETSQVICINIGYCLVQLVCIIGIKAL